ncbi:arrestin domain-containing protein 3a isoform X2 [Alosa pseudoharengus]|uniref:arrestin domain-containing protein 3a isoform X2 n=1 Tax=Alosa pseudoharengus TaxID=34774 RepID=UPI003F8C7B38
MLYGSKRNVCSKCKAVNMFGETFKNVSIDFISSHPNCTFSSGDMISGEMKFELSKDVKIQHISMTLKGKAKISWTTRRGSGKSRHTRVHSAKLELFKLESIVVQGQNDEITLKTGIHVYPFRCQIPHGDFPSSFVGLHGRICYTVIFGIHRSWHRAKQFESEFKFVNHVDCNNPALLVPISAANSKTVCCLWCVSGPIMMDVRMERKGYVPGEIIQISAEFGNGSSRRVVPKALLVQKQAFYTAGKSTSKIVPRTLVCTMGQAVQPNHSDVYCELMLTIPEDAPTSIANCPILEVEYVVMVSLEISGASNLETLFPIVLGTIPLRQEECRPPPYSMVAKNIV